jgi:hypothetical protein
VAATAVTAVALVGVVAAVVLAPARRSVAAAALLAGPNVAAGTWTTAQRTLTVLALALLGTIAVVLVERLAPAVGSRGQRAGRRALTAALTLGVALALLSLSARGSVHLLVSVLGFDVPALSLDLRPSVLWALAAGAGGGAVAGLVGSLIADVVRRPARAAAPDPVPVGR